MFHSSEVPPRDVYVTQPYLPPLDEFIPYLQQIWDNKFLTNSGPFHQRFERALCEALGVPFVCLFTNATIALLTGLQVLGVSGEVITTPYSFVATSHSLLWNRLQPVFVDVEPDTLNLDASRIEAAITPQTSAILPVHCYGRPCDARTIQAAADAHGLKVLYDAAHAFGVRDAGGSVLRYGDLSVVSFHATKAFNTFEGGAIVCHDAETKERIDQLKNFGFSDDVTVGEVGLNGKMSEFNAALGLLQLEHFEAAIASRREVDRLYRERLSGVRGIRMLDYDAALTPNYGYFPILVGDEYGVSRDALHARFKSLGVHTRRYFYPLISEFPMYRDLPSSQPENVPVASGAAARILCLPIYHTLDVSTIDMITGVIADLGVKVAT